MIRVLVVDDSPAFRQVLRSTLARAGDIEIIGEAGDPYEARAQLVACTPDVVLLDVCMPRMEGDEFLRHLMATFPLPVIVVSGDARERRAQLRAAGAAAVIDKPGIGARDAFAARLIDAVRGAASGAPPAPEHASAARAPSSIELIAIGASTGGASATACVLEGLGADGPPVVIAQHILPTFSGSYAAWLDGHAPIHVREARSGEPLEPGCAFLAPSDRHLKVVRQGGQLFASLTSGDKVNGHRPSIDVLFSSIVRAAAGEAVVAVLLTGMGSDGASGMLELRHAGARTIVEDPADCVVPGMPEAAIRLGAAAEVVRLRELGRAVRMSQRTVRIQRVAG